MPNRVVVPEQPGFDQVFRSRDGVVGHDLSNRATRVQIAGKAQAGVKSGRLRSDITKNWVRGTRDRMTIRVGSSVAHSYMHHEGTRPHVIRPKNARALRWVAQDGSIVFARSVQHPGTRPNRFLTDSLHLAVR